MEATQWQALLDKIEDIFPRRDMPTQHFPNEQAEFVFLFSLDIFQKRYIFHPHPRR
ncbi:MAG: hypothetical protein JW808_02530 [Victivallales bacterium]|nr:hypothetical protein [Victivallales bacterium]